MSDAEVVLYVGPGCGLCDEARELLRGEGIAFREATDPRYLLRAPVVEIDGRIVAEGRLRTLQVRHAMRKSRRL